MDQTESVNGDKLIDDICKYGNSKANYEPFDGAVSYPLHSQDFVRTGFQKICPTLAARDYKDPKVVTEITRYNTYMNYNKVDKVNPDIATTLCARDYKGFGTGFNTMNGVIECTKL